MSDCLIRFYLLFAFVIAIAGSMLSDAIRLMFVLIYLDFDSVFLINLFIYLFCGIDKCFKK